MVERTAGDLAAAAANGIDDALALGVLVVSAGVFFATAAGIDLHGGGEGGGEAIVAIQKIGAFEVMAVAVEDDIDAVRFEDGQDVAANFDQLRFGVGVMIAFGISGMVEENDEPILGGGFEVLHEPLNHGGVGGAAAAHGIESDKVNIGVVERI